MADSQAPTAFSIGASISVMVGSEPRGDVIFLPTDVSGTPGQLNGAIRKQLNIIDQLPVSDQLAKGYAFQRFSGGLVCYVVTVGSGATAEALWNNLRAALQSTELAAAREIWVPLMGTGTGRLPLEDSFNLILTALQESGWLSMTSHHAVIATPDNLSLEAAGALQDAIKEAASDAGYDPSSGINSSDPLALPKTQVVDAALALAGALSRHPHAARRISSRLMFFALVESQQTGSPEALRQDPASEIFAAAVHTMANAGYEEAWQSYFRSPNRPSFETGDVILRLSGNMKEVLLTANTLARKTGARVIGLDHLIQALLSKREARLDLMLERMRVDPAKLLSDYLDARLGQITTRFHNDMVTREDRLGYATYAKAIVKFLTHAKTPPPLSISIQAPWGAGKSSLMHLVREELDPESIRDRYKPSVENVPDDSERLALGTVLRLLDGEMSFDVGKNTLRTSLWTVWFNVWQYETAEQVWAGLVDAIVSQVADRLSWAEREKFLLKLQLARIDDSIIRKKIYDRVVTIWWSKVRVWCLTATGFLTSCLGLKTLENRLPTNIEKAIGLWPNYGALMVPVILSIYLIGTYFLNRAKVRKEPATFSLADYIRVPDYGRAVGEIHQIHADLRRVLRVVPHDEGADKHAPLVVFIDDLDRCSPSKVASVVEGVSMLLASDTYRCMFVIGMDPQMVAAALEKAHEDVRRQLPRYERTVPLGWRFMDKFVQLPFTIPPADAERFKGYVGWLGDIGGEEPSPKPFNLDINLPDGPNPLTIGGSDNVAPAPIDQDIPSDQTQEADIEITHYSESLDVGVIIRTLTQEGVGNPREMKRMVNLARFYLTLRAERRTANDKWRAPTPQQYARWIAMTLRWPDMMRWLQWGADEANWSGENPTQSLIVRRLHKMEAIAACSRSLADWKATMTVNLAVPVEEDTDWACDAKLFEFMKAESVLPAGDRLSAACMRGFW